MKKAESIFERIGRRMMHPFLSRRFDDKFSQLLIRSSESVTWNVIALGAGACLLFLLFMTDVTSNTQSISDKVLIAFGLSGSMWSWLAAMAHSAKNGRYARVVLLFVFWPLAFGYNWRAAYRHKYRQ